MLALAYVVVLTAVIGLAYILTEYVYVPKQKRTDSFIAAISMALFLALWMSAVASVCLAISVIWSN